MIRNDSPITHQMHTVMRRVFGGFAITHAVLVLAQPFLAGLSLEGQSYALDLHYMNGMLIMGVAALQLVSALLWWKPGGGTARPLTISVVLLSAELAQFLLGTSGSFALHLPLGIFVVLASVGACAMAFRRGSVHDEAAPAGA